jgi:HEAT repeat protein
MDDSRINSARNFIKAALKAKKMLQIYPANNILYLNSMDETFSSAQHYLSSYGDLVIQITSSGMLVDSEQVYQSSGKADNFALFFFKEGIRELTFKEGLPKNELEEFLKLTGIDFDRNDSNGDFISSFWEKGFENIKLTIDEIAFFEDDGLQGRPASGQGGGDAGEATKAAESPLAEGLGTGALFLSGIRAQGDISAEGLGNGTGDETGLTDEKEDGKLINAYQDGVNKEEVSPLGVKELTPEERGFIIAEIAKDSSESNGRLVEILIEMLGKSGDSVEAGAIAKSFEGLIVHSLRMNDLRSVLMTLRGAREIVSRNEEGRRGLFDVRESADNVMSFCDSPAVMEQLGRIMDSTKDISEEELTEYAKLLGKGAVQLFMSLLENLQTISARRIANNILINIGKENIDALVERLKDPTWYVVRNIIYVLRNIGDNAVLDDILRMSRHEHPRVRLEVVKALTNFKSVKALQALKDYFNDSDSTVRMSAIAGIGTVAKESSGARLFFKDAILAKIKEKGFDERDFKEKKSFYEALALVSDGEVDEFMVDVLKKRHIFSSRKIIESKACAAYYLGLSGGREALSLLEKLGNASDPLLREHVAAALNRIKHE